MSQQSEWQRLFAEFSHGDCLKGTMLRKQRSCSCFDEMIDGACPEHGITGQMAECASGSTEPSEAPLDVILTGKRLPDIDGILKTDFDTYALTVTGEVGEPLTAEQYAHAYFNTPEARRADELEAKSSYKPLSFSSSNFGSFEVIGSGHSEPSDVPIDVMLEFKS